MAQRPQFGFSVTPGSADGVAAEAAEAEALGYDRIGVWDSPALFREPWVTLGAMARETERVRLGTWNPLSRHQVVTASAAASFDDLAPGRVIPNPPETGFLRAAVEVGCETLDGLEMLVEQGRIGFELWTGVEHDVEAMRDALRRAFGVL